MKCIRKEIEVDAALYEIGKGMEDGYEKFSDLIVKGWIVTDSLVKIVRENGTTVCPFISSRRGKTFIEVGDYIITAPDGEKLVCGSDKFNNLYSIIE